MTPSLYLISLRPLRISSTPSIVRLITLLPSFGSKKIFLLPNVTVTWYNVFGTITVSTCAWNNTGVAATTTYPLALCMGFNSTEYSMFGSRVPFRSSERTQICLPNLESSRTPINLRVLEWRETNPISSPVSSDLANFSCDFSDVILLFFHIQSIAFNWQSVFNGSLFHTNICQFFTPTKRFSY